jgi:hypothetical protein
MTQPGAAGGREPPLVSRRPGRARSCTCRIRPDGAHRAWRTRSQLTPPPGSMTAGAAGWCRPGPGPCSPGPRPESKGRTWSAGCGAGMRHCRAGPRTIMMRADMELPGLIKSSWHRSQIPADATAVVLAHAAMVLTAPPSPPREHDEVTPVLAERGESVRRRPAGKSLHLIHARRTGSVQQKKVNSGSWPPASSRDGRASHEGQVMVSKPSNLAGYSPRS